VTCYTDILEYMRRNYRRIYAASLAFTADNVRFAVEAYVYGVTNGVGPTAASLYVQRKYGRPVYTRLANFLRETRLWLVDRGRWAYAPCQVTASYKYFSSRKGEERARITATIPIPLGFDLRNAEDLATLLLFYAMDAVGFNAFFIDAMAVADNLDSIRTGAELADFEIEYADISINDMVEFPVDLEVDPGRGKWYFYSVRFEESRRRWLEWFELRL